MSEQAVAVSDPSLRRLSYREARVSPCLTCASSPCCTHLMLRKMAIDSVVDLDYAFYLTNFEGILLGFVPNGAVRVYLRQPCGFLDVPTGLCTVHSTGAQPAICSHYNAFTCKYRYVMPAEVHPSELLVDRHRLAWFADNVTFDDDRRLVDSPDWATMQAAFAQMPLDRAAAPSPPPDPVAEEWRAIVLSPTGAGRPERRVGFADPAVSNPCQGCSAWCCTTLVFSRDIPETASDLDFFRYSLGFPSVRVGVAEDGWAIIVRATCRHLDRNRCSVYGTDERPLRCGTYDALSCTYRVHFGTPQPDELVLIDIEQFPVLAESMIFDDRGNVRRLASVDELRCQVDEAERAAAERPG
ncbi:MAG: hypothetical protein M3063_16215 [Actinomycetota bacterium]|nr:hypothetical protein [Actinomycetota bacterium]